jgi:spore coat protein A
MRLCRFKLWRVTGATFTVNSVLIAPAQRIQILVDFSAFAPGTTLTVVNTAPAPYPNGAVPVANTTALVMRFTVGSEAGFAAKTLPAILNPELATFPTFPTPSRAPSRITLWVNNTAATNPAILTINGQVFDGPVSQVYELDELVDIEMINLSNGAHPIHIHLITFQIISTQPINTTAYYAQWTLLNGGPPPYFDTVPRELDPTPYLTGNATQPTADEKGFLDVVTVPGNSVTTVRVKFHPQVILFFHGSIVSSLLFFVRPEDSIRSTCLAGRSI